MCASLHEWERFVKDDRAVKRPSRIRSIPRNDAHLAISQCAIELLGTIPLPGIEHEQRSSPVTGDLFNGLHKRSPNSSPTLTGEHKEFLHFGPVARIRFRGQSKLDRAGDLARLARHEQHAGALSNLLEDRTPILPRIVSRCSFLILRKLLPPVSRARDCDKKGSTAHFLDRYSSPPGPPVAPTRPVAHLPGL